MEEQDSLWHVKAMIFFVLKKKAKKKRLIQHITNLSKYQNLNEEKT